MDKVALTKLLLNLAKSLGSVTLEVVDAHFDELKINPKVAPFVKVALTILKNELAKTDGLVTDELHKFDIQ